jgi:hypothetical protein
VLDGGAAALADGRIDQIHRDRMGSVALRDQVRGGLARALTGVATAAHGRSPGFFTDLLVPIAVSGIPDQIALLLELIPNNSQDSYWWAWREALKHLPLTARQKLIEALLAGDVPIPLREVILSGWEPDLSATIASAVEANNSLRAAIEKLAAVAEASAREFALGVLARIADLRAAELLLAFAISEPALRPRVGRVLVDARWPRLEGARWPGMSPAPQAVTSIRKRLLSLTADPEPSLRHWAASVLADIDASVDGEFPLEEPRHPHLASGIPWPFRATFSSQSSDHEMQTGRPTTS